MECVVDARHSDTLQTTLANQLIGLPPNCHKTARTFPQTFAQINEYVDSKRASKNVIKHQTMQYQINHNIQPHIP